MNYVLLLLFLVIDNIAVGKLASQAGNYHSQIYRAWVAVDGDTGQDNKRGYFSCARVNTESRYVPADRRHQPAWWAVDLANGNATLLFVIKNVTIYFEKDVTLEGMLALCMSHLFCKELSYCYEDSHV